MVVRDVGKRMAALALAAILNWARSETSRVRASAWQHNVRPLNGAERFGCTPRAFLFVQHSTSAIELLIDLQTLLTVINDNAFSQSSALIF